MLVQLEGYTLCSCRVVDIFDCATGLQYAECIDDITEMLLLVPVGLDE